MGEFFSAQVAEAEGFVPFAKLLIFFHDTDAEGCIVQFLCSLASVMEQGFANTLMAEGGMHAQIAQLAMRIAVRLQGIVADDCIAVKEGIHGAVFAVHMPAEPFFCGGKGSEAGGVFRGEAKGVCHGAETIPDQLYAGRDMRFIYFLNDRKHRLLGILY